MPRQEILEECWICLDIDGASEEVINARDNAVDFERVHAIPGVDVSVTLPDQVLTKSGEVYGNLDNANIVLRSARNYAKKCSGRTADGGCGQPELRAKLAEQRDLPDLT